MKQLAYPPTYLPNQNHTYDSKNEKVSTYLITVICYICVRVIVKITAEVGKPVL